MRKSFRASNMELKNIQEKEGKDPVLRLSWDKNASTFLQFFSDFDLQSMLNYLTLCWANRGK